MSIFSYLSELTTKKNSDIGLCDFNGFVEDYLMFLEEDTKDDLLKTFLSQLLEKDPSIRICVNLGLDINPKVVTNRIIRYKDAFKLPKGNLKYPYIVYGKNQNGEDRALIFVPGQEEAYVKAKGLYYCLTEPLGVVENARNEIIAMSLSNCEKALEACEDLFIRDIKTGIIQRRLDRDNFANFEFLREYCLKYANELKDKAAEKISAADEREVVIYDHIVTWFLLKKLLYVQYMMNKQLLMERHNNDIKEQRGMAKKHADEVPFISFSEMWKF